MNTYMPGSQDDRHLGTPGTLWWLWFMKILIRQDRKMHSPKKEMHSKDEYNLGIIQELCP